MASGWSSQESCPDRKLVKRVVMHVTYTDKFKAALVYPEDVIKYRAEDGALSEFFKSSGPETGIVVGSAGPG